MIKYLKNKTTARPVIGMLLVVLFLVQIVINPISQQLKFNDQLAHSNYHVLHLSHGHTSIDENTSHLDDPANMEKLHENLSPIASNFFIVSIFKFSLDATELTNTLLVYPNYINPDLLAESPPPIV